MTLDALAGGGSPGTSFASPLAAPRGILSFIWDKLRELFCCFFPWSYSEAPPIAPERVSKVAPDPATVAAVTTAATVVSSPVARAYVPKKGPLSLEEIEKKLDEKYEEYLEKAVANITITEESMLNIKYYNVKFPLEEKLRKDLHTEVISILLRNGVQQSMGGTANPVAARVQQKKISEILAEPDSRNRQKKLAALGYDLNGPPPFPFPTSPLSRPSHW